MLLAAERQPPALQPAGAAQRRVRAARAHPVRVHVAAVRGVEGHERNAATIRRMARVTRVVIIGGGPGGYEAALVGRAARCRGDGRRQRRPGRVGGAHRLRAVEDADRHGRGDDRPSRSPASSASGSSAERRRSASVGVDLGRSTAGQGLAAAQSARHRASGSARASGSCAAGAGSTVRTPRGRRRDRRRRGDARRRRGAGRDRRAPARAPDAQPDGERILTWEQVYDLDELPERLIVVGSGVTGAEFAGAYNALGATSSWCRSRDRVLPGEDADAAEVLEDVFTRRGMTSWPGPGPSPSSGSATASRSRSTDGRTVEGSHCLMAVGSVPNTDGHRPGGGRRRRSTRAATSRSTRSPGRRRAGSTRPATAPACSMLASVAAMQGRIAMWHALGDAVAPLDLKTVSSNVFTDPEIATVGWTQADVDAGEIEADGRDAPAGRQRAGQDAGHARRVRQAVLPARHRHRHRRRGGGPAGERADPSRSRSRSTAGSRSTRWRTPSRSIRRCPARSPRPRGRLHLRS